MVRRKHPPSISSPSKTKGYYFYFDRPQGAVFADKTGVKFLPNRGIPAPVCITLGLQRCPHVIIRRSPWIFNLYHTSDTFWFIFKGLNTHGPIRSCLSTDLGWASTGWSTHCSSQCKRPVVTWLNQRLEREKKEKRQLLRPNVSLRVK